MKLKVGGGEGIATVSAVHDGWTATELGFGRRRVMEFGAKIGNGDGEAFMVTGLREREREERVFSL